MSLTTEQAAKLIQILPDSPADYERFDKLAEKYPFDVWGPIWAAMGRIDLYFLCSRILSSKAAPYFNKKNPSGEPSQWLFNVCREIGVNPDGFIDIYAREHYKTTIVTFGLSVQNLIVNPEETIGIFSFRVSIAQSFVKQIKDEFEKNDLLKALYPNVCYEDPAKESDLWTVERGFNIKRVGNTREPSVEGNGLVDSQPISRHYGVIVYDDCVTEKSVTTEDQMEKTLKAWENSSNLSKEGGKKRHVGTRYHRWDLYQEIIDRGAAEPRIRPCYELLGKRADGSYEYGEPVLYTEEYLSKKREEQGMYTFSCQMLCDPLAGSAMGFKREWLRYYKRHPEEERRGKNVYILCDPANEKKKDNDFTVFAVIGVGADKNFYLLDLVRERLDLSERGHRIFRLVNRWDPMPIGIGWERYGLQADIQFVKHLQEHHYGQRFNIQEVAGQMAKEDRIRRLVGPMEAGRWYFPEYIQGVDPDNGHPINLMDELLTKEIDSFPLSKHDDMLDAISRIFDMTVIYPDASEYGSSRNPRHPWDFNDDLLTVGQGSWLSA